MSKDYAHIDIYKGRRGALKLITHIGIDYDGMDDSVENMKKLVDEIVEIANAGIKYNNNFNGLCIGYKANKEE